MMMMMIFGVVFGIFWLLFIKKKRICDRIFFSKCSFKIEVEEQRKKHSKRMSDFLQLALDPLWDEKE
jgi:hypothetical protein